MSNLLPLNRLIFAPTATVVAETRMVTEGFTEALEQLGIVELADGKMDTPIANMAGRVYSEDDFGGTGEDLIEFGGRQCYRSWERGRDHETYINNVMEMAHGSVLSHHNLSFLLTGISRSLSLELVRHHVGTAPSQESQRYVDAKDLMFVVPPITAELHENTTDAEKEACPELTLLRRKFQADVDDYAAYQALIMTRMQPPEGGVKLVTSNKKRANEAARAVLPNAAETRMLFTTNLRALRNILMMRGQSAADLEIRRLAVHMLKKSVPHSPVVLGDVSVTLGEDGRQSLNSKYQGSI